MFVVVISTALASLLRALLLSVRVPAVFLKTRELGKEVDPSTFIPTFNCPGTNIRARLT